MTNTNTNPNHNNNRNRTGPTVARFFYFVSFLAHGGVFGNMELPLNRELTTIDAVHELEGFLRERGYSGAIVMGYALLRTERVPAPRATR